MSCYVKIKQFGRWLDKAQRALVSKNKIRKDLWEDFGEIMEFKEDEDTITISSSDLTTIMSFLQNEGRGDTLSNDERLNWIKTLLSLRKQYNTDMGIKSAQQSEEEETDEISSLAKQAKPRRLSTAGSHSQE